MSYPPDVNPDAAANRIPTQAREPNGSGAAQAALVEAAFVKGYADQREADAYYRAHPGQGYPVPADKPVPPGISATPKGAGYMAGTDPAPMYYSDIGAAEGPTLPPAPDMTLPPPAVTGFSTVYPAGYAPTEKQAAPMGFAYVGAGGTGRRSLWSRITGRGR